MHSKRSTLIARDDYTHSRGLRIVLQGKGIGERAELGGPCAHDHEQQLIDALVAPISSTG
jgi:hypothetical protein